MKFRFINDHKGQWPVRTLCRVLGVSPAGYYAWRSRPDNARAVANQELLAHVRRLYAQHRGRYGSPRLHAALRAEARLHAALRAEARLHAALRAEGRGVSRGRVERLMRQ